MRREGDALVAHWDALPADTLAVTAQTDEQTLYDPSVFWEALLVVGILGTAPAAFAGWQLGKWLGRRGRTSMWGLLVSPLVAFALYALSYAVASSLSAPRAPGQAAFNQVGDYNLIVTLLIFIAATAWHFLVAQVTTYIACRRKLARLP
jgi:heme/copper-type cytochrome/quinol oxidase subunit 3